MGRDKALLSFDEGTLVERALSLLEPLCEERLLCCGGRPRYADLGVPLVLDHVSGAGPLAGLAAALERTRPDQILVVVPVDMPWLSAAVLRDVVDALVGGDEDVACARSSAGLEPLVSAWRAGTLGEVRAALARGDRRMVAPCAGWSESGRLRLAVVEFDSSGLHRTFDNLNTPLDWHRARMDTTGKRADDGSSRGEATR